MEELSQHILDIACNSLDAGATKLEITVLEDLAANVLEFTVRDNGRGIASEDVPKILDPFFTTKGRKKKIGLGIPLLKEAVERCDGVFKLESKPGGGTMITARFPHDHIDRAPLGDIGGTIRVLLLDHKTMDLTYRHSYNDRTFSFNTTEFKTLLGEDIPLEQPEILLWLEEHLTREIANLKGGELN